MKKLVATTAILAALTACSSDDPVFGSFYREAGSSIDNGTFGQATINNIGVQSGEIEYTLALAHRFADEVPTVINFEFNSATIDAAAQTVLLQQADWIKQFPEVRFKVYGHTDLVGSNAYNQSLGLRRANAVVQFFVAQGISRDRLEAVVSFGETQPLIVTEGRERANRRTVTEVTGFVETDAGIMNGKYAEVVFREYINSGIPKTGLSPLLGAGGGGGGGSSAPSTGG